MIPIHLLASNLPVSVEEQGAFLFCPECEDVHRVSKHDNASVYDLDGTAHPTDDLCAFLFRHNEHRLTVLRRANDAEVHSHARHDPMCRVSWEVADESDRHYVVSLSRQNVESPRCYDARPGRLVPISESIDVDAAVFRAVIDEALFPNVAPDRKLAGLVEKCRRSVATLGWDSFDPIDEDREDPNTQLACLPQPVAILLEIEATVLFPGGEGERVIELLRHELRWEIPIVRMRRHYVCESG